MGPETATRSRENTRARLLEAASEVFAESGVEGASVEAISERAGFTRGAFYSNFSSKDELLLEIMRRIGEEQLERVSGRVRDLQDTELAPRSPGEIVAHVLDPADGARAKTLLMSEIRTNAMRDPALARAYLAMQEQMAGRVAEIVRNVAATYRMTLRMPVEEAARLLVLNWDSLSVYAVLADLDDAAAMRLVTERTAMLAAALADLPD